MRKPKKLPKKRRGWPFFHPAAPRIIVFSWRIRAYDFQRVIRPSLALLRCPVVGCSAPSLSFMQGGWDGQEKTAP